MRRFIALAALMAGVAAPAWAEAPAKVAPAAAPDPAAPDPTALAAARDLMKASDLQGQMKALGPSVANATEQQMRGMFTDAKIPDGLQAQMATAIKSHLASMDSIFTPELIDEMAVIYARHYSADDLKHIATMMSDPVMVRFRQTTPLLMADLMPAMMKAMQPWQKSFQGQLMTIIRTWVENHPDDKAKLRSPLNS